MAHLSHRKCVGMGLAALVLSSLLASSCSRRVDVFFRDMVVESVEYFCVKIPTIVESNGVLIAMGEARRETCDDVAATDLIFRRSFDGGETWTDARILFSNSSTSDDDVIESNVIGNAAPVLSASGRLFVPFTRNNRETWMTFSDDDGESWAEPVEMPELQADDWVWVGLGPPSGLKLRSTDRLLIPGYHGKVPMSGGSSVGSAFTKGHTILSDDDGASWFLGATDFGEPFMLNELQAAELDDGTIIVNAREINDGRILAYSYDQGLSFNDTKQAATLHETFQGCEGSTVSNAEGSTLYYSGVQGKLPGRILRQNLTLFESMDGGESWALNQVVEAGSSAYSALLWMNQSNVGVLYERATCTTDCPLIFLPDYISWSVLDV